MSLRQRIAGVLVCGVCLMGIGRFGWAQNRVPVNPTIVSSTDLRFVVESQTNGRVVGHFEARINGNWTAVQTIASGRGGIQPLTSSR